MIKRFDKQNGNNTNFIDGEERVPQILEISATRKGEDDVADSPSAGLRRSLCKTEFAQAIGGREDSRERVLVCKRERVFKIMSLWELPINTYSCNLIKKK